MGGDGPDAVDRASCASEAVLLTRSIAVLAAPTPEAEPVQLLPRNAPIYLCGQTGGYRGIMFPADGQRAACSLRAGSDDACPLGWVREPVPVELAG